MSLAAVDTYRFGPYEVRTQTREIYKHGLKLKLRPQPFQVLQVLVERSGEVVTRDELRRMLWSAETFVDFEHGLNTSIKELRRVLNDSAREPRYIQTMPRLGYRLLAPVETQTAASAQETAAEPIAELPAEPADGRHSPAWWWRLALYVSLAAAPVAASWVVLNRPTEPASSMPAPLTSFLGSESAAAWSPDGRQVAFHWNGEQKNDFDIYVMQPGSSQTLRLTFDAGHDEAPAWSPDGRWIAYRHMEPDGKQDSLRLVSPLGGPSRTVFSTASRLGSPSWMRNGRAVVMDIAPSPDRPFTLWAVSVDTGERRELTRPPVGIPGDIGPAVSPDDKAVAFCRQTAWRTQELYLLDLQPDLSPRGDPRRLTDLGYVERPGWTPDGRRLLFGAFREGAGLWQISRNGGQPRPVFGVTESASLPALAVRPTGETSLIFTNTVALTSVWRYGVEQQSGSSPVELAPSSRSQKYPSYSPDGRKLAFTSTRTGRQEIWVSNADGSEPVQLTNLRHRITEQPDWSPACDVIAFISQDRGDRQVYVISSTGGATAAITHESGIRVGGGWSRDGAGYYYTSARSGRSEVWKAPRGGGEPTQMTTSGGQCGFESAKGSFYYWSLEQGPARPPALIRRSQAGEEPVSLATGGIACQTAPSPAGFYYRAADTGDIYLFDENSGQSERVLRQAPRAHSFTMSPDGRWLAIERPGGESQDLMIMERFR